MIKQFQRNLSAFDFDKLILILGVAVSPFKCFYFDFHPQNGRTMQGTKINNNDQKFIKINRKYLIFKKV